MTCDHDQSSLDYWAARLYRWHNARDHKGYYLPMPLDLRGALGVLRMHGYTARCGSSRPGRAADAWLHGALRLVAR